MPSGRVIILATLLFILLPAMSAAAPIARLAGPPLGDRWFSIVMNKEWVGFSHTRIQEIAGGYELFSEGSVKLQVMGTSRESTARETYQVGRDLSLRSFTVEQTIDGTPMMLTGTVTGKTIKVRIESHEGGKDKILKFKKTLLPPPALNLYPAMQGAIPDKEYKIQMLDVEGVKVKGVEIKVLGLETLPGGKQSLHLQNDLYPFVDNDIWLDVAGNTIRESVRDGLIITQVEDGMDVAQFIAASAVARKDLILQYSLIRVNPPVREPASLKRMVVLIRGIPSDHQLFQGDVQVVTRNKDDSVQFEVTKGVAANKKNAPLDTTALAPYLEATDTLPSGAAAIKEWSKRIIGPETGGLDAVAKLNHWVAREIKGLPTDSLAPLETINRGEGNSQSHARLYVSMARAAGIPSRFVSGLIYVKDRGFLYHSWAESYVGNWLPVDPTFDQVPADASHIKLAEGDTPAAMALLGRLVGSLKAQVLDQQY